MKIAYILSGPVVAPSNGVVSQALTWKVGLEQLGHEVVLIDMWQRNEWASFDVIHYFGFSIYMRDHIMGISRINSNIVVSPILDPNYSVSRLKVYAKWGNFRLNLTNPYHGLNFIKNKIKLFLVRSEFEKQYMVKGFGIRNSKCPVVPLSYHIELMKPNLKKEPFCLHISLLTDERKNVKRLIQAAKKYDFKLVLGGKIRNDEEFRLLKSWIDGHPNVEYKGFLSHEGKVALYNSAKVFALPSTNEGVGIVALEAASLGCDIVITNLGGPREYYNGLAKEVDPYDVDAIGGAVKQFLTGESYQPELSSYIQNRYSLNVIAEELANAYKMIIN